MTINMDPYSGHVFVFRGKRGDYVKVLYWDGTNLCLHARRKIYEFHKSTGSPAAQDLLERISIEDAIRGKSQAERLKIRTDQAVPRLVILKEMYESALSKVSAKSSFAEALRYALNRWQAMTRYTTDGGSKSATTPPSAPSGLSQSDAKTGCSRGSDTGGQRAATILYDHRDCKTQWP